MKEISEIMKIARRLGLTNIGTGVIPLEGYNEEYIQFLGTILTMESNLKEEKKYKIMVGRSHLPPEKHLENFDLKFQPHVTQSDIRKFQSIDWIEDHANIIFVGSSGTGKTHLATAIGYYFLKNDLNVFYATARDLIFYLNTQDTIKKSQKRLGYLVGCDLVIVDELGYTEISREDAVKLYDLLNTINSRTSMIVISNRKFSEWGKVFNDEVLALTLVDRIIEQCDLIDMGQDSYRLATHRNLQIKG